MVGHPAAPRADRYCHPEGERKNAAGEEDGPAPRRNEHTGKPHPPEPRQCRAVRRHHRGRPARSVKRGETAKESYKDKEKT